MFIVSSLVLGSETMLAEGGGAPRVVPADVVGVVLGIGWVAALRVFPDHGAIGVVVGLAQPGEVGE